MRKQIPIGEVLAALAFSIRNSLHKIEPGIVKAYYPGAAGKSPPCVDVQPAVNDVRFDTTTGERVPEEWPILPKVPVGFPKFGGYQIAGPMVPGDVVLLLSFDLDTTKFRATGIQGDPADTRRHGGSYWIALPFDITDPGAFADPGPDLVVTTPGGGHMLVGVGATEFVALADKVDANFTAIKNFLASIFPPSSPTTGLIDSVTSAPIASGSGPFAEISIEATGSTVLKAK